MAVIHAIHTKTVSKLSYIDIIHYFEASLFTTTIWTQYDDYRNHTTIIDTTKQSQKYVFFRKFDVFHDKNGWDCVDKTYSNWYVLKYSEIVFPDTLNPLKHIGTTTNCTTIGIFTLNENEYFILYIVMNGVL